MSARLTWLVCVAFALGSCQRIAGPPELTAIEPENADTRGGRVRILGSGFGVRVLADLDDPAASTVDRTYAARLVSGDVRVELEAVTRIDASNLQALVPRDIAIGVYRLEVIDPFGRTQTLAEAFTVSAFVCPESTACDDQDACTQGETCQAGACGNPTFRVACGGTGCEPNTCEPSTGTCVKQVIADGAACDDANVCTAADQCAGGVCKGSSQCGNTAPRACSTLAPTSGPEGSTFVLDATCSSDAEDAALTARFDFDGDGAFDGPPGPLSVSRLYTTAGVFPVTVEVRDQAGLTALAKRLLTVHPVGTEAVVTTALDEGDPGASPAAPGGIGLSLREAMTWVNGSNGGTPPTIRFATPMRVALSAALPALVRQGATLVGSPGVVLDFAATQSLAGGACISLEGDQQWMVGIEALNCPTVLLDIRGQGTHVADCRLLRGARGGSGVRVVAASVTFGPGNEVADFLGAGVELRGAKAVVEGNRLHHNRTGLDVGNADEAEVTQNVLYANSRDGIEVGHGQPSWLWNNTVSNNGQHGISTAPNTDKLSIRNNALTFNGAKAIDASGAALSASDPNLFFGNPVSMSPTVGEGPGSVRLDPRYLGAEAGDYRVSPLSPAVNAGVNLGLDLNGPGVGNFEGSAPDLGAVESSY